jgi:hypothetical protein
MKKLLVVLCLAGCSPATPSDREVMYATFARDHEFKCKAYRFDLASGLTPEVPAMTEACR